MNGQNNTSKSNKIWGLFSAHFIFGKSTRKQQTMVKLQLTANVIAKNGYQIKPKPVKSLPINTILIFSMSDKCIFIAHSWHVETVIKLSFKKDTPKIEVTMEPDAKSNYTPVDKATYGKVKEYVKEKHDLNVSSLYIAQIKEKCGLDKRDNYNLPKSEDAKVPKCPPEKENAIMDAFKHFGVI